MKRKHYLLDLMGGMEDRFVLEALEDQAPARSGIRKNRVLLIAAVVALTALLVGCVAAFLGLQDRMIGQVQVTQRFDEYGAPVAQPEKTWYIASMSGFGNSPAQQASREWYAFSSTYQPQVLTNETDNPEIPNNYEYSYCCFDQTMVDKLDQIAETYDLQLLGTCALAQTWQQEAAMEALGISGVIREGAPGEAAYGPCIVYPPYNFVSDVRLTLTGEGAWREEVSCQVHYLRSGYLAPNDTIFYDPESTQEWEYTTAEGTRLLLALNGVDGTILAQREECTLVIQAEMAWRQGPFLEAGTALPTREDLEQLAGCFDYQVSPQAVPMDGLQAVFDAISDPDNLPPEEYEARQYASYAEYLQETYFWPELVEYAFYDIDGDGQQDLITSYGEDFSIDWLTIRDGQVVSLAGGRGPLRLCQEGIVEYREPVGALYLYYTILGQDPEVGVQLGQAHSVSGFRNQWKIDEVNCTAQEAEAFMAQYQPLALDWKPLTGFPMDEEGTTFAELAAREKLFTGADLAAFYSENCPEGYGWFELRDINEDGVEDLLLSRDGEQIDMAYTCRRSRFLELAGGFYLCRDNVQHSWDTVDRYNEGILERHTFQKYMGNNLVFYQRLTHNLSTGEWTDQNYAPVSEEEAEAFLEKYAHTEQKMLPISQLTG